MVVGSSLPQAIAVRFKDLERWDIKSAVAAAFRNAHPGFVPFGQFIEESTEMVRPFDDPEKMWPVYGVNNRGGVFFNHHQKGSEFNAPYKRIRRDWFFHNPTRANVGSLGRVPEVEEDAITSPEYQVWKIKDQSWIPQYVDILIQLPFFQKLIQVHRVGAVKERLYTQNLLQIPVPPHPKESQQAIVERWEQAQKEIAAEKQAIGRQENEQRDVVSYELGIVTRSSIKPKSFAMYWNKINRWGFNMCWNATYKLPAPKFSTARIKEICHMGSGGTPLRRINAYYDDGDIPWVKTTEVRNEVIMDTEEKITRLGLGNSTAKLYPPGSLLVAMYGQGATRGRTAKLGIEAATNQACCVLYKIDPRVDIDYLWFFLISEYDELRKLASGNNQPNLNSEMIANYEIPLPPLEKQRQIVGQVNALRLATSNHRKAIETFTKTANAEIEDMIMGTKRSHREQEF